MLVLLHIFSSLDLIVKIKAIKSVHIVHLRALIACRS